VTTEAQILDLMRDLQSQINMTIVFITHNLGVVAQMCDLRFGDVPGASGGTGAH
jgi:ABC-type dipeptide/oligopeptide/nickel transport system ATPase component